MATTSLRPGALAALREAGDFSDAIALKVTSLTATGNGKFKCELSDGSSTLPGVLTSQVGRALGDSLKVGSVVSVTEASLNSIDDKPVLVVAEMELVPEGAKGAAAAAGAPASENAPGNVSAAAVPRSPARPAAAEAAAGGAPASPQPSTPPANKRPRDESLSPGPTPPPPSSRRKSSSGASQRPLVPIAGLNPYNSSWRIRARVVTKGPLREFGKDPARRGKVFSVELADAAGGDIEATFWREAAEKWHAQLEVGRAYEFSRGSVRPANKRFSTAKSDYSLSFDLSADIEPYEPSSIEALRAMAPALDPVAISTLPSLAERRQPVDVVGVVVRVGPLGTVRRKADQTELSRREVTLADEGGVSVGLTLWGDGAERDGAELEERVERRGERPVLAVGAARVSTFDGASLSTLSRSTVSLVLPDAEAAREPEPAEGAEGRSLAVLPLSSAGPSTQTRAIALRRWWDEEGGSAVELAPVGERAGAAGGATPGRAGGARGGELEDLQAIVARAPDAPGDKPAYGSVRGTLAAMDAGAALYYLADPETNRKVVEGPDGGWTLEATGAPVAAPVRRYVAGARLADASGQVFAQLFNEQAKTVLARSADDLHALREADDGGAAFRAALAAAAWREWNIRLKASAQEFNGEIRKRYTVVDVRPVDFVADTKTMLQAIAKAH